jgi:hypothetical protein
MTSHDRNHSYWKLSDGNPRRGWVLLTQTTDDDQESSPAVMLRKNNFNSSTKLKALSEDLHEINFIS